MSEASQQESNEISTDHVQARAVMFTVSAKAQTTINQWSDTHECDVRGAGAVGAIGGRLVYCFTPTGIGVCTVVKCACGDELDVTDYENW